MKKIAIAEGITANLTNKTYSAMVEYYEESDKLNRWQESAYSERDWEDLEYYYMLENKLEEKFQWLWK
jgi:hypothetical protein